MKFYSIVIPVYNRPDEIEELLETLLHQTYSHFEVLIVEDGSSHTCAHIVAQFKNKLDITYYFKENSGQGFTRNYGFERAKGDFFIVFDSDCLIPPEYFERVEAFLNKNNADAFGGPDKAHASFTTLQKAISYSMTSPFTTGGIRGNKQRIGTFHPRSFNMGISRAVFEQTGGYQLTRMGEDIAFSTSIVQSGFKTALISDAFVYHKRRTSLLQFYKQLHFFGRARVNVNSFFPGQMKLVHLLPLIFVIGLVGWISTFFWAYGLFTIGFSLFLAYFLLIFLHAAVSVGSLKVGLTSLATSFIQLFAYGMGIVVEIIRPRGNRPFAQK